MNINELGPGANLHGADLHGANLSDADLRFADLHDANLRFANLRFANLRFANLRGADLHGANLRFANLRDADLRFADLRHADLRDANLLCANLRDADLLGANLRHADFSLSIIANITLPINYRIARMDFGEWSVCIYPDRTTIGCQYHSNDKWLKWSPEDVEILEMATGASEFWRTYGPSIKAMIVAIMAQTETNTQKEP